MKQTVKNNLEIMLIISIGSLVIGLVVIFIAALVTLPLRLERNFTETYFLILNGSTTISLVLATVGMILFFVWAVSYLYFEAKGKLK